MNIFVLDEDPAIAARHHCDIHCSKMVLETAQLLSGVHAYFEKEAPYRLTHKNHPCAVWARNSRANYDWLTKLGIGLSLEYTHRYNKIHASQRVIEWAYRVGAPAAIEREVMTQRPLAMPERYWASNAVAAYRRYYIGDKARIAKYEKGRDTPTWFVLNKNLQTG